MLHNTLDFHLNQFMSGIATDMKQNLYMWTAFYLVAPQKKMSSPTSYQQAWAIMNKANSNLRSWFSNSKELQNITSKDQTSDKNKVIWYWLFRW